GPFHSSPLQVVVKEGAPGEPTKFHVCQHLSYKGTSQSSINDEINSGDFTTHWGKASDVAKIVCSLTPPCLHSQVLLSTLTYLMKKKKLLPPSHVHTFSPHLRMLHAHTPSSHLPTLSLSPLSSYLHNNWIFIHSLATVVICFWGFSP
ncbi:hypothetical protein L208DRAFT_1294831, partial [Tricholoma matsutake]